MERVKARVVRSKIGVVAALAVLVAWSPAAGQSADGWHGIPCVVVGLLAMVVSVPVAGQDLQQKLAAGKQAAAANRITNSNYQKLAK